MSFRSEVSPGPRLLSAEEKLCGALRGSLYCIELPSTPLLIFSQEVDELVEDWTPEPLVAPLGAFEEAENEKRPVIVGYEHSLSLHNRF